MTSTPKYEYMNEYGLPSRTRLCTQISKHGMATSFMYSNFREVGPISVTHTHASVFMRFLMMFIIIQVNNGRLRNLQRCQWQVSRVDNCPHRSWQNRRLCRALSFRMLLTPQIYVIKFGNPQILMP